MKMNSAFGGCFGLYMFYKVTILYFNRGITIIKASVNFLILLFVK